MSGEASKLERFSISDQLFADLVGERIVSFLFDTAPTKVKSRILKALYHFNKADDLNGFDDEMAAIRLIACEEELVVAIFEVLKLKADRVPDHSDFIGKFKNHQVKLALSPVISQFGFVLNDMFRRGMTLDGLETIGAFHPKPRIADGKFVIEILDSAGKHIFDHNPLATKIAWKDQSDEKVIEELLSDFVQLIEKQQGMTLRQFISARADFRNKILYAEDGGPWQMESLENFLPHVKQSVRNLLFTLAALLGNDAPSKTFGLVSQFITFYRRVLTECKLV